MRILRMLTKRKISEFVGHFDFPTRTRILCRSHVPSIPEKPFQSFRSFSRRTTTDPLSSTREILRDGFTERARWIFAIPNPFRRIEGQAMVRDVCNSISLRRPGYRSRRSTFSVLLLAAAPFPIPEDSRTCREGSLERLGGSR